MRYWGDIELPEDELAKLENSADLPPIDAAPQPERARREVDAYRSRCQKKGTHFVPFLCGVVLVSTIAADWLLSQPAAV